MTPTRALIAGLILGAVFAAAGAANHWRLTAARENAEAKSAELQAADDACVARYQAEHPLVGRTYTLEQFAGPSECHADVQRNQALIERLAVVDAQRSDHWAPRAAGAVLAVLAAPWLWYFLLRRVAELRSAISGDPPSG
jgi:hypothetical protein